MTYEELKKQTNKGWNTWFSPSMTAHVLLPYGFAINLCFRDHAESENLRNLKVGEHGLRPGGRSWNGEYTCLTFNTSGAKYTVESTADGKNQFILVTPECSGVRAPSMIIEACILWGKEGAVSKENGRLSADFPDGYHIDVYTDGEPDFYLYSGSASPFVSVKLDKPTAVSTCPCTAEEVRARLDCAREKVLADEARYGINSSAYQAMKSCTAWDTVYEPEHDRICSPVSRSWSDGWGCDKPNSNNFYHWGGLLACVAIDYEEEKGDI